jgi:hypothetical protein
MPTTDFEISPGKFFGEWLHDEIASGVFFEQNGFMPDRAHRVGARLQQSRQPAEQLRVEVPWLQAFTAFTAPGKYIYFGRRLLERCPNDETAAFVIAHEIAHHDLGHLDLFRGGFAQRASRLEAGTLAVLFFRHLQKRIYGPEHELDADRHGLKLCLDAGYDGKKCLHAFHILELIALDFGDLNAVYGLDPTSDDELSPEATLATKARIWLWQRQHGYLPIQDRHAMARRSLASLTSSRPGEPTESGAPGA